MKPKLEIERKFLIKTLPDLSQYPFHFIEQAYLCVDPVVRIRRDDDTFYLTYKGRGLMTRREENLPLNEQAYLHLREKADGIVITKKRYFIPLNCYTIELDVFLGTYEGLIVAEVEFESEEEAISFIPPEWFGEDVTNDSRYQNSTMSLQRYSQSHIIVPIPAG